MRWLVRIFGTFLFLVFILKVVIALTTPAWPDPVDGVDLAPTHPPLAQGVPLTPDNGMFHIRKLNSMQQMEGWPAMETIRAWTKNGGPTSDHPELLSQMKLPRDAFALFRKAAACPEWRHEAAGLMDMNIPHEVMYVAMLATFEATRLAEEGDWASLERLLNEQLKVGSQMRNGARLIELLIAVVVINKNLQELGAICESHQLPEDTMARLQQTILAEEAALIPLSAIYRNERAISQDFVDGTLYGTNSYWEMQSVLGALPTSISDRILQMPPPLFWPLGSRCNATLAHLEIGLTYAIDEADKPYDPFPTPWDRFKDELHDSWWHQMGSDPIARSTLAHDTLKVPVDAQARGQRVRMQGTAIVLAILRAERRTGKLPASLADLVPDYLAKVPEDGFLQGSPLVYRVKNKTFQLYSVGTNQVDDGGHPPTSVHPPDVVIWPPSRIP